MCSIDENACPVTVINAVFESRSAVYRVNFKRLEQCDDRRWRELDKLMHCGIANVFVLVIEQRQQSTGQTAILALASNNIMVIFRPVVVNFAK